MNRTRMPDAAPTRREGQGPEPGPGRVEAREVLLDLSDVSVRYGRAPALDRASLRVCRGDTIAVLGPDGSGKSTLLRTIAGLISPASGIVDSRLPRDGLGYAGSTFDLYADLTVAENLSFFGRIRGMSEEKLNERIEAMLTLTGLGDARNRLASRLSGGMKKGLALGCALVHQPALLLLDEPTVGVDPVSRQRLWDIIAEATTAGTALVFSSCYLDDAHHAARLAIMSEGRLSETSVTRVMGEAADWHAWILSVTRDRSEVRARLAAGENDPRVYLRQEGVAALARDEEEARRLLADTLGEAFAESVLAQRALTFEDAFVLAQGHAGEQDAA